MERKIGEVFQDGDVTLEIVKCSSCAGCYYLDKGIEYCHGQTVQSECGANYRKDETSVIFKEINNSHANND